MKNIYKIIIYFILGVFGGIFGSQILWPLFVERPLFLKYRLEQNPVYLTEKKEIIVQENTALISAIEKVEKSIVAIKTKTASQKTIEGSGLILSSDGLIITLADLIPKNSASELYINGEKTQFKVLKNSAELNLVLLKAEKSNLSTVGFGNLEKIKLGQRIFIVGTKFIKNFPQILVNEGIIKTFNENSITTNILEEKELAGSSLFDIEGNFLGLNTINQEGKVISIPVTKIKNFSGFK